MPLCPKCHQKEARVHVTAVCNGLQQEVVHLCEDCARTTGLDFGKYTLDHVGSFSVTGKKCDFCGKDAFSAELRSKGEAVYWCFDCGGELSAIRAVLLMNEHPELLRPDKEPPSLVSLCADPELSAASEALSKKAVETLKEKRRQDGRDRP